MQKFDYQDKQIIFHQGEITEHLFVIEQGKVAIFRNYGCENERLLTELGEGKFFAETAIASEHPRTVTAVAVGDVRLQAFGSDDFEELQKQYPDMALQIIAELSERLRRTTDRFMEACRTISESMNEKELAKNSGLFKRLKKFASMYDEACKENYEADFSQNAAKSVSRYNNYGSPITKR